MPRIARPVVAAAAFALLTAGCGGAAPVGSPGTQNNSVAFSRCMRSNGVSSFPDPDPSGAIPKESLQQLGVSNSRFQTAQNACRNLLPNGGSGPTPAQVQRVRVLSLEFARCVRSHGVPNFPDPNSTGRIPDPARFGIDQGSPKFRAANQTCGKYRPPYIPSNSAYDVYARAHRR